MPLAEPEILIHCDGQWLALEADYWFAMLRLIHIYGLAPEPFLPLLSYELKVVHADASAQLVACLRNSLADIPLDDLWPRNGHEPDPMTCPPLQFLSGCGICYLTTLIEFVDGHAFAIKFTRSETFYRFSGPQEESFE